MRLVCICLVWLLGFVYVLSGLLGRQRADQSAAHLLRRRVDFSNGVELFENHPHHPLSFVDVRQFAAPEHDRHDDLVLVLQKTLRLIHLEIDVVFAGLGPKPNFLDFCLMDVRAVEFLLLLIFELAEVHDPADGRLLVRSHLDKIEAGLTRAIQRLFRRDDPELFAVAGDHPDRRDPDLLVNAMLLLDGSRLPDSDADSTPQAGKKANTRAMQGGTSCVDDTPPRRSRRQAANGQFAGLSPGEPPTIPRRGGQRQQAFANCRKRASSCLRPATSRDRCRGPWGAAGVLVWPGSR